MLNIVIIGCGHIANDVHMPSILKYIKENSGLKIAACADIDENRAISFAKKFNIDKYFLDYSEMLRTVRPDIAVCLVSPEKMADAAVDILNAGVHALIEKPPGLDTN